MKENSIEEDITRIKQRIEDVKEYIEYGLPYSEYLDLENSFDNILSDYKRILKENEQLRTEVNSLKEENEELKIKNNAIKRESEAYAENMIRLDNELNLEKEKSKYEWIRQNCLPQELVNKLYIPVQKVKDKIEELQKEYNKLDKQVDEYIKSAEKDVSTYYENKERISIIQTLSYFIGILQELLESEE